MTPEGVYGTCLDQRIISEEHSRKNELEGNLCPHMKDNAYEIVFLFSRELLLCQFVVVVIFIAVNVMQCEDCVRGKDSSNSCNVCWHDWRQLTEE